MLAGSPTQRAADGVENLPVRPTLTASAHLYWAIAQPVTNTP